MTDPADQAGQMYPVIDLYREFQQVEFTLRFHFDSGDIGIRSADFGRYSGQNAFFLDNQQTQVAVEAPVQFLSPVDIDPFFRFFRHQFLGMQAFRVVYHKSASHIELADNRISRNRQTTCCQLDIDPLTAIDDDRFDFLRFFLDDHSRFVADFIE